MNATTLLELEEQLHTLPPLALAVLVVHSCYPQHMNDSVYLATLTDAIGQARRKYPRSNETNPLIQTK